MQRLEAALASAHRLPDGPTIAASHPRPARRRSTAGHPPAGDIRIRGRADARLPDAATRRTGSLLPTRERRSTDSCAVPSTRRIGSRESSGGLSWEVASGGDRRITIRRSSGPVVTSAIRAALRRTPLLRDRRPRARGPCSLIKHLPGRWMEHPQEFRVAVEDGRDLPGFGLEVQFLDTPASELPLELDGEGTHENGIVADRHHSPAAESSSDLKTAARGTFPARGPPPYIPWSQGSEQRRTARRPENERGDRASSPHRRGRANRRPAGLGPMPPGP